MRQKALSPRMLRQLPLIFAWSLAILMACSQLLLVQSTSKSMLKYSTWSIRLAIRLASLWASLLRPLTPGPLAATPCSAVLAYRPRSWPRVAGGRLDAPASMAASTARRALLSVWRICAAQAWPCGSASQTACRSRIRPRSASSAVIVLGLTPVRVVDLDLGCGRGGVPDVAVGVSGPWWLSLIHISEPTRLGMISYAVFCLQKKKRNP